MTEEQVILEEDIVKSLRKSMYDTWSKIMDDFVDTAKIYHDDPRWIAAPKKKREKKNGN